MKCRGAHPPLFPLAVAHLLDAVHARRAKGDVVNVLWLRSQMLRYVQQDYRSVPAEFQGEVADYPGAARRHNFTAGNS